MSAVTVRPAEPGDAGLINAFVQGLAAYEKLADQAVATEADFARDLFGANPRVFCEIAFVDAEPAGFALWFYTYSTFLGRHGIWLEDLFVLPAQRGAGAGKALLTALARRCVAEGLGRLEWSVLDWNSPAIEFYKAHGAAFMDEWRHCRVTGEALARLGGIWESSSR